jgi:protein gp37
MASKIEWTDETWNPATGCSKVSPGCKNCYAEQMAKRLAGRYGYPTHGFDLTLHLGRLTDPLRWRKRRRVFVCSMGDLFHLGIPDWYIDRVWAVMLICQLHEGIGSHVFQVLTKRPRRMMGYLRDANLPKRLALAAGNIMGDGDGWHDAIARSGVVHPNVWVGISAENQATYDGRLPHLIQTPAAVRFLSLEPLLGPIDLGLLGTCARDWGLGYTPIHQHIHWVIAGGESGPGAQPAHPDWFRDLRDQCAQDDVPFFFKQWGAWWPLDQGCGSFLDDLPRKPTLEERHGAMFYRVGKKHAGRLLDGELLEGMP